MKHLSKDEAISKFGKDFINEVLSTDVEPTSRLMYPAFENPSHIGKEEYAGEPIKTDGYQVTAYYYASSLEETIDVEPEFEVEEIW